TLWPLFHDLAAWGPVIDHGWWERYHEVNGCFADAAVGLDLGPDAFLWVHDYQLLLLPIMLRQRLSRRIGFFLHTPFPSANRLGSLPWRAALLEGMLGADVVAFQGPGCQTNFLQACQRFLSVDTTADSVRLANGRWVRTHSQPISIDARAFATDA